MPGRIYSSNTYRYGFNGKRKDDEAKGSGAQYDYGFRIYDPRLGKFLSADPLTESYPWYSPYHFAGNKPIVAIDLDGLEEYIIHEYYNEEGKITKAKIFILRDEKTKKNVNMQITRDGRRVTTDDQKVFIMKHLANGEIKTEVQKDLSKEYKTLIDERPGKDKEGSRLPVKLPEKFGDYATNVATDKKGSDVTPIIISASLEEIKSTTTTPVAFSSGFNQTPIDPSSSKSALADPTDFKNWISDVAAAIKKYYSCAECGFKMDFDDPAVASRVEAALLKTDPSLKSHYFKGLPSKVPMVNEGVFTGKIEMKKTETTKTLWKYE